MDRRRLIQGMLTVLLVLFLLVLVVKFRPRQSAPRPVALPEPLQAAQGSLTARGFRFEQESAGKVAFVLTALSVTERPGEAKALQGPRLAFPTGGGETVIAGEKGLFDPATRTLRIWEKAALTRPDGWVAEAPGFRMTPEGEVLSEESVAIRRGTLKGRADLLRYQRDSQKAYLEGSVRFDDVAERSLVCSRLTLDLAAHRGDLAGPVALASPAGTLRAPGGTLILTPGNALRQVVLGTPAEGEGAEGRLRADSCALTLDDRGATELLALRGEVHLAGGAAGEEVRTALLEMRPGSDGQWRWSSPGALTVNRGADRLRAPAGSGLAGGGKPFVAELEGPVAGDGPSGRYDADRAKVEGAVRTLEGHVRGSRGGDRIEADRVRLNERGGSEAEGSVKGAREAAGAAPLAFRAARATAGPGGYPLELSGAAVVDRGAMHLEAPVVKLRDRQTAEAAGGATCLWSDPKQGDQTLTARTILYDGAARTARASGGAEGRGRGYLLRAKTVTAKLDAANRPVEYVAEGAARLEGAERDASGDRLAWRPAEKAGEAESEDGRAVLIQKSPYRRVEGARVSFKGRDVEVKTPSEGGRRGSMEADAPRQNPGGPASGSGSSRGPSPSPSPAMEKKTDGR